MELDGKRILITGAGGFVGSRLCEVLTLGNYGAEITALVHNVGRAARIGRLPLRIVKGDVTDEAFVKAIVMGMDAVVHLALGGRNGIVKGTNAVAKASLKAGVKRFIHMSSAAVCAEHGVQWKVVGVDENQPLRKTKNEYADAKIDAEACIKRCSESGLPTVILRPGIIFGPYSFWVDRIAENAKKGNVYLINAGSGVCNSVYIDNLISAVILSFSKDNSIHHTFFISDDEVVLWKDFKMPLALTVNPNVKVIDLKSDEVLRSNLRKSTLRQNIEGIIRFGISQELRNALNQIPVLQLCMRKLLSSTYGLSEIRKLRLKKSLGILSHNNFDLNKEKIPMTFDDVRREIGKGTFNLASAKKVLGYKPIVSFADGLMITRKWLVHREEKSFKFLFKLTK